MNLEGTHRSLSYLLLDNYPTKSVDVSDTLGDDRVARQLTYMAQTKASLVLPRRPRLTPEAATKNLRAALDKKESVLYALAEAQKDVENCRTQMSSIVGNDETKALCDSYLKTDDHTAVGSFVFTIRSVTFKPYTIPMKGL
jgi:hypothetical protein